MRLTRRRAARRGLAGLGVLLLAVPASSAGLDPREVVKPATDFSRAERFERYPAGAVTSVKTADRDAFSRPSTTLGFEDRARFFVGNGVFKKLWVTAPASTASSDGLGPLYNARSCQGCHLKDGRGHPPTAGGDAAAVSFVLGLSLTPEDSARHASPREAVIPEPNYGTQLQDLAVPGLPAEGRVRVAYDERPVTLDGGEVVSLRRPRYRIDGLSRGPLHPDARLSPRVAQPMIGLGLLEAVPEADVLAHADPDDRDGDGVSGRPNRVWDAARGETVLGRFGWKAAQPTVRQQSAVAFATDMGLSTSLVPKPEGDCTPAQARCDRAPTGGSPEVDDRLFDLVTFYAKNLAVPVRRGHDEPAVLRGKAAFYRNGCAACHVPKYVTRADEGVAEAQRYQLIWPYSDMLLHDMGDGLADDRPQGAADGREWRTQPLWGVGLTERVNGHTLLLHDGRARNVKEAILWHGGEARAARDAFKAMPKADRDALIAFVNSL